MLGDVPDWGILNSYTQGSRLPIWPTFRQILPGGIAGPPPTQVIIFSPSPPLSSLLLLSNEADTPGVLRAELSGASPTTKCLCISPHTELLGTMDSGSVA